MGVLQCALLANSSTAKMFLCLLLRRLDEETQVTCSNGSYCIIAQLVFSSTEVLDVSADYFENIKDQHLLSHVVEENPRWFQHPPPSLIVRAINKSAVQKLVSIQLHHSCEGDLWILAVIYDRGILPSMISLFFLVMVVVLLWKQKQKLEWWLWW